MAQWTKILLLFIIFLIGTQLVQGIFNNTNVYLKASCIDANGNVCGDTAKLLLISPDNITINNNTLCKNVALGTWSCDFKANITGIWFALINFTNQNITREYNIDVRNNEENVGGNMIMAMIIFIPLFFGLLLILGAGKLFKEDEHKVLKLFIFLFSFVMFFVSIYFGVVSLTSQFGVNTELEHAMVSVLQWIVIIFGFVIIAYFLIDGIVKVIDGVRRRKQEKENY